MKLNDIHRLDIGGGTSSAPTWVDITSNATGTFPAARTEHTASVCSLLATSGTPLGMLVFGGSSSSGVALADLHAFRFDTMAWGAITPSGVAPQARKGHTATLLLNSLLAVFGGSNQDVRGAEGRTRAREAARTRTLARGRAHDVSRGARVAR